MNVFSYFFVLQLLIAFKLILYSYLKVRVQWLREGENYFFGWFLGAFIF